MKDGPLPDWADLSGSSCPLQIPKESVIPLFGSLLNFFAAEANVVHSYTAICFERLLALKVRPWSLASGFLQAAPMTLLTAGRR